MCFVTRLASEYSIQFSEHMCFAPKREGKIQFRLSSSMLTLCNYNCASDVNAPQPVNVVVAELSSASAQQTSAWAR
jgi:hypothetical protein